MEEKRAVLKNGELELKLLLPGSYSRSRYDHSGMVEQISMGENTFLSRELIGDGVGLGGVGLACCFEWADTALHDKTAVADMFPQIGVGLLKRTDTSPFLFTRDYPVIPFEHVVSLGESCAEVHSLPHLCNGSAVEQYRRWSLEGKSLVMTSSLKNVGSTPVEATEFCHNFFRFNGKPIDEKYRLSFPYTIIPRLRRGQIILERDALRLGKFDEPTASTAFWLEGFEGLNTHWMKLEHDETRTGVLIEEDFPLCRFYSWNNKDALCPESFVKISLAPGESLEWTRKYSFYSF